MEITDRDIAIIESIHDILYDRGEIKPNDKLHKGYLELIQKLYRERKEKDLEDKLNDILYELLEKHNAVDMCGGENYSANIKGKNGYVAEVWAWGQRQPDIQGDTIEAIKQKLREKYDKQK